MTGRLAAVLVVLELKRELGNASEVAQEDADAEELGNKPKNATIPNAVSLYAMRIEK